MAAVETRLVKISAAPRYGTSPAIPFRAPRLPPSPHPFEDVGCLLPSRSHAGQDHEPWATGNFTGLNLAGVAQETAGKGDGPCGLELLGIPLDEFVEDEQGLVVHGPQTAYTQPLPTMCRSPIPAPIASPFAADESTGPRLSSRVPAARCGEISWRGASPDGRTRRSLSVDPSASARP